MASPATSIGSPCPTLAPRLLSPTTHILPAAENTTPQTSCGITTNKEWVVPPRPKPGRKPATDTPPTKRKAQNRAAQRAFRERRAARVNELEDKLKEIADETATRDAEFQSQISQLTFNNSELAKENAIYKSRVESLQRELETLQKIKSEPVPEQPIQVSQVASPTPSADYSSAPSPSWTNSAQIEAVLNDRAIDFTSTFARKRTAPKTPTAAATTPPAGGCNREGGCPCSTKRTTSPPPTNPAPKRSRPSSLSPLETDFTSYPRSPYTSVPDPCGFCSDGTPCVCAEVANAMDMEDSDAEDTLHHTEPLKLAPMIDAGIRDMLTPPASVDGDAYPRLTTLHPSHTIASTPRTPPPQQKQPGGGCPPGGCAQCKADPMSTLFCQSVNSLAREQASSSSSSSSSSGCGKAGGCCGGSGACGSGAGGDIEGRPMQRRAREKGKTYIPASAAYQTLSRHKMWEQVEDLGTLVRPLMIQSERGKCPEVEVSSVRDVLKMLDLRFGRD